MPAGEAAIAVSFALVDKMPMHTGIGNAERVPIKNLAIKPWEEITPKALLASLPQRVLRPFSYMVNAHAQARLIWCQ